jgi:NAD(P)-dependent dehydrogenase (short-subunit alcohol dehydrogenase family)
MAFNFKHQLSVSPNTPHIDLSGQAILITGSNQGIGLESARQLLVYKASIVILAVRSITKGEAARTLLLSDPAIKNLTIRPEIKIMEVDMADYKSVMKFARGVKGQVKRQDVLLLMQESEN